MTPLVIASPAESTRNRSRLKSERVECSCGGPSRSFRRKGGDARREL